MNAWLITWEGTGKITDDKKIVAILDPRKSRKTLAELVEFIYSRATFNVGEVISYTVQSKRSPYKVLGNMSVINNVQHGDRLICGNNPHLYARKVSELKIETDLDAYLETVTWQEPPIFRLKDKSSGQVEVDKIGLRKKLSRDMSATISRELEALDL